MPSESRRTRLALSLAEGLVVGGLAAVVIIPALLGGIRSLAAGGETSATLVAVVVLLAVAFLRRGLPMLVAAREGAPDRSEVEADWREIRSWRAVVGIALATVAAVLAVSLAAWGWERTATSLVSRGPALAVAVVGLGLYVLAWRRLGRL